MRKFRIISAFLSFVMILGMLANLSLLPVFAEETTIEKDANYYNENYLNKTYRNVAAKLESMTLYLESNKYRFYIKDESGEFALENKKTGQVMFSNPYSMGAVNASADTKYELLSQIIINFSESGVGKTYTSFKDCVMLDQLKVKYLKNGIRVEYTIGNEETRKLIPMQISKERFETQILANIPEGRAKDTFTAFFQLKSLDDPTLTTAGKKQLLTAYPIVETTPIYVFTTDAKENEKIRQETVIKTYCPEYTFEELQYDHELVGYEASNKAPAVFKMALEYSLDESGLDVRLGANGIRFDESTYTLESIKVLPFVGAGSNDNKGYIFIPDGSGALIRFEDFLKKSVTISGKLYGQDYAFHTITGSTQQIMRLPVYGVVEEKSRAEVETYEETVPGHYDETTGQWIPTTVYEREKIHQFPVYSGFLAIIEEGESFSTLYAETGGTLHNYCTAFTAFNPRPSDKYNLSDSISIGSNATWTVVSERKYTGSYKIKYVMLDDELLAEKAQETDKDYKTYEASYVGMANAYRDYLYAKGQLKSLTAEDVAEDLPLYINSFGTIDTKEKILSFPVTVETPLTTFDDLKSIYNALNEKGIKNINFRLSGFTNGGMLPTVPTKVEFQKKVGGNSGYKEFLTFADQNNIGVYPDFDFIYVHSTDAFDGLSFRRDAVKTIDNRYTVSQVYDSVFQSLNGTGNTVISVSAFSGFYEKFNKSFNKLGGTSVSISTLGSDLNSDFDEDDPYNREDAKAETLKLLEKIRKDYANVMSDAGNAYVFKYVDHLLNVSLDSSRYTLASQSIPFMGMVLHGSIQFTGTPINTTGNIGYELLKIIESGAAPYFLLSYRNTAELKDNPLFANYFSVQYGIWEEDLIKYYNTLNEVLKDLQTEKITDHEFLIGERIPSASEIEEDNKAIQDALDKAAIEKLHQEEKDRRAQALLNKINGTTAPETPVPETPSTDTETTPEEEEPIIDVTSKYITEIGTIVKVTYSNGTTFILNYNDFGVKVDGIEIEGLSFKIVENVTEAN